MIDYIEISKYLSNGYYNNSRINNYNKLTDSYSSMKVSYNKDKQILKIRGSLAYFAQGHNFWFDVKELENAIIKISELLEVDLFDAEVKIIEYGVVIRPHFSIQTFIENHLSTRGYEEDIYSNRGKKYVRKDKAFSLKFYSIWANIDNSRNKVSSEIREMLKRSYYSREYNPIRYEIHGNPQKFLKRETVFVSDLLSAEFEEDCKKVLLEKYRKIKKFEHLKIEGIRRFDAMMLLLTLFSEKDKRYQEKVLSKIDTLDIKKDAKLSRKSFFRKKFREVPREKCSYSIENLIIEAFRKGENQQYVLV